MITVGVRAIMIMCTKSVISHITLWQLYHIFDKECLTIKTSNYSLYKKYEMIHFAGRITLIGIIITTMYSRFPKILYYNNYL